MRFLPQTGRVLFAAAAIAVAGSSPADTVPPPARTTPKAVEALRNLNAEHFPVKGDTGPTSWSTGAYSYDPAGNIIAVGSSYFIYDTSDRLTTANVNSGTSSQQQSYSYDPYGNMVARTLPGQSMIGIGINGGTNHLTGNSVQYDDAGSVSSWTANGNTMSYTYDGLNMLKQVGDTNGHSLLYLYTADDQRFWTFDLAANTSHWKIRDLGGRILRDFAKNGNTWSVAKDYFYRGGLLLASSVPATGVVLHFSLDHLNTPRLMTDQNGGKVGFHVYWPFGDEWTGAGMQESPAETLKFTGHERDADLTGNGDQLDYMHARYFAPGTNRFMSVDSAEGDPTDPQSLNRYIYGRNNPMKMIDLDGRSYLVFNRATETLTLYSRRGAYIGSWSASNKPQSSAKIEPLHGVYNFYKPDRNSPHFHPGQTQTLKQRGKVVTDKKGNPVKIPTDSAAGSYGAGGIFRLSPFSDSQGPHAGVAVHAGKDGVFNKSGDTQWQTPTNGCVRTTPEAIEQITTTAKSDPLDKLYALNGNSATEAGYFMPALLSTSQNSMSWMVLGTVTVDEDDQCDGFSDAPSNR
jgi:RHS repeat-associated protein